DLPRLSRRGSGVARNAKPSAASLPGRLSLRLPAERAPDYIIGGMVLFAVFFLRDDFFRALPVFFLAAFFLPVFFLAVFLRAFLLAFFFPAFFLLAFFFATFFFAVFFLAVFFFPAFFLAVFFLAAFFLATATCAPLSVPSWRVVQFPVVPDLTFGPRARLRIKSSMASRSKGFRRKRSTESWRQRLSDSALSNAVITITGPVYPRSRWL